MLKQVFDKEQLKKILTPSDIVEWRLLARHGDIDTALTHISNHWRSNKLKLVPMKSVPIKKRAVYIPSIVEDDLSIKLLDRFIRRIYHVRQSDRNRIIRQIKTILKDSGKYHLLRLDIKDCFESINFSELISRLEDDLILSPESITLLKQINEDLLTNHSMDGLPRGLSISSTLAELHLETLDEKISSHPNIFYSARYVDDIIVICSKGHHKEIELDIRRFAKEIGLSINSQPDKYYSNDSDTAHFEYLGYEIEVTPSRDKENSVSLKISQGKLNEIKSRIVKSFIDHKRRPNIGLLKRRLDYISMLKVVKKGKNGDLLAGIGHNYQYVTDHFNCLKAIDGFLCSQISSRRFSLTPQDTNQINKISIYNNVKNNKIGNFSATKTIQIMRVLKDA